MPEQLFCNTGIATYVWVLTNRKERGRKKKVQLINACTFWRPMRKNLGDKRRQMSADQIQQITDLFTTFKEGEHSKIFDATDFGYRKITVERPLGLNFQASPERIAKLKEETAFQNLAVSKRKQAKEKGKEEAEGKKEQDAILTMLATLPATLYKDRVIFETAVDNPTKAAALKLKAPLRKTILSALSERDEMAEICRDSDGDPEPDPELRDTENVPLKEDVRVYFDRDVKPHVSGAWINMAMVDHKDGKDGKAGKVGYEINFNRYFYKCQPPRKLEEIEADIKAVEKDILAMLREVAE